MRIFLRTFNNKINSKLGTPLPEGQYRGTVDWLTFQNILIDCLKELGHETFEQEENPLEPNIKDWRMYHRSFFVHKTFRDIIDYCPGRDFFWMQLHCRELFTIDSQGWGTDHSGNKLFNPEEIDQDEAKAFCKQTSSKMLESGSSKCIQPSYTDETPRSFILVPVQIPRDYTIKHHSPITVKYFIESIQAWAIETETQVCFKMHPHNKHDSDLHNAVDEAQASSKFVHKVEGNIHELINRSNGLFVINSGTGFESLIHGKPVATFGDCDYNLVTWNADLRRLEEAREFLYSYKEEYQKLAYKYVWWYWHRHAYDVNAPDTKERLTQYLKENL